MNSNHSSPFKISLSLLVVLGIIFMPAIAQAQDITLEGLVGAQDKFDKTVRDLGTAFSYIPADPAEAHGIIGLNIGAAVTAVQLPDQNQYMDKAFDSDAPGSLALPKVQVEKGLPFVEVGGFVAGDPDGNTRLFGGQVKYPILDGSTLTPAVSVRGHGTQLVGVDELDLTTYGGDVSISKGIEVPILAGITPYAGYSMFQINGSENAGLNLDDVSTTEGKIFGGARIDVLFWSVVAQADIADEVEMYTLRMNFGF